ncbi:hypothetical protein STCU_10166 [Strigomonas culicis]|uniref:Uncharacterized protein n=1 Tax=Strigomonas culicis TaxID=28005 RepID=S9UUE4_9TRYP|nr:hypothetical protein STCU_10166 [Strigomonas culicis]|eukprot:EPY18131.1 hypothetical protein STCU_10166 [Strigomonas culicis]
MLSEEWPTAWSIRRCRSATSFSSCGSSWLCTVCGAFSMKMLRASSTASATDMASCSLVYLSFFLFICFFFLFRIDKNYFLFF